MGRRGLAVRVLLVAMLATSAGCSALLGGTSTTKTLTPAPVPTPSPTPTDPRVGVAPGVSTTDVTHPEFLAGRHAAAARNTSYVLTIRYHETRRLNGVTANVSRGQRIVLENATVYRRDTAVERQRVDGNVRYRYGYSVYGDGRAKYVSWLGSHGEERVYRRYPDPTSRQRYADAATGAIQRYLDVANVTVSRYDVPASDRRYYLVTGTRSSLPTVGAVRNYSARAVIREDGFVRTLNVTYDATDRNSTISARYRVTYREVGTASVTPPGWADEARAEFAGEETVTDGEAVTDGEGVTSGDRTGTDAESSDDVDDGKRRES